ncbi:MAG: ferritin [Synergistaceae bacterium]
MLNKHVSELINDQINKELYSAYLYLDISNYFYDEGLEGFGNWYKIQTMEERDHAMLMMEYLQINGEKVTLKAIAKPDKIFNEYKDGLLVAAEHERYVTDLINKIYEKAAEAKEYKTLQFLDWFVKEQVEEENNADTMVKKFELFGSDPKSLYMLDSELKGRVYTAPSLVLD